MDKYAKKLQHKKHVRAGKKGSSVRWENHTKDESVSFITVTIVDGKVTRTRTTATSFKKAMSLIKAKKHKLSSVGFEDLRNIYYPVKNRVKLSQRERNEITKMFPTVVTMRSGDTTVRLEIK